MINRLFSIPLPPLQSSPSGGIGRRDGLKIHCPQQTCRFEPGPGHKKTAKSCLFSFAGFTPIFAHDSGESVLVSAPHPVFCARFGRKCARSGLRPSVSRTIQTKMRASGLVPSFARDSGENARDSAPRPFIRARFCRKCAHSGSAPLHSRAILAIVRVQRPLRGDSGVFWAETLRKQTFVGNQDADFRYI